MEEAYRSITRWARVPAWWLLHPGMNIDRFGVLAALSTYADERGICTPSQGTLARRLKRSRPWVNRVIAELVSLGLIKKRARSRKNGGTTSCEYVVRFSAEVAADPIRSAEAEEPCAQWSQAPVSPGDSPCHDGDRNQVDTEQNPCPRMIDRKSVV